MEDDNDDNNAENDNILICLIKKLHGGDLLAKNINQRRKKIS
ncbi:hypothetical protein [Natronospora cellulosivora (SeqCode)]